MFTLRLLQLTRFAIPSLVLCICQSYNVAVQSLEGPLPILICCGRWNPKDTQRQSRVKIGTAHTLIQNAV